MESPTAQALNECESTDSRFEENVINNILIPKLIKLGFKIPIGKSYRLRNDQELYAENQMEAAKVKAWADIAVSMKNAGMQMGVEEFSEKTGLEKVEIAEEPTADMGFNPKVKAKINEVYRNIRNKR